MQCVILAGGLGSRLSEETDVKPKPMVEVGGRPILWHIMKIFASYGVREFVICCGYKSEVIKSYFANYALNQADFSVNTLTGQLSYHNSASEDWVVQVIDTGIETMTGGRLKRVADFLDDRFFFTYGDGLADIDLDKLLSFHEKSGRLGTLTAVSPPGRFGLLGIEQGEVISFQEKPVDSKNRINGGFFVLEKSILHLIEDEGTVFERYPLEELSRQRQLGAYLHNGFWQCMDTLSDKRKLEHMWSEGNAPWKIWD